MTTQVSYLYVVESAHSLRTSFGQCYGLQLGKQICHHLSLSAFEFHTYSFQIGTASMAVGLGISTKEIQLEGQQCFNI